MARVRADQELQPSVLDRLIDADPSTAAEAPARLHNRVNEVKAALRRDLEWLLNARQRLISLPPGLGHLRNSLLTYGLPDFTHATMSVIDEQRELRRLIEVQIARFEPRLSNVSVILVEGNSLDRCLRFRIDAILDVDPIHEPISFDSILELSTKVFEIGGV